MATGALRQPKRAPRRPMTTSEDAKGPPPRDGDFYSSTSRFASCLFKFSPRGPPPLPWDPGAVKTVPGAKKNAPGKTSAVVDRRSSTLVAVPVVAVAVVVNFHWLVDLRGFSSASVP